MNMNNMNNMSGVNTSVSSVRRRSQQPIRRSVSVPVSRLRPIVLRPRVVRSTNVSSLPSKRTQKKQNFDISAGFSDIFSSLTSSFNRPLVLISILAAFALVVTHQDDFSKGIVGQWCGNNTNPLAGWVCNNTNQFLGLAVFVPTVLDLPRNLQVTMALLVLGWIFIIPESSIYQYLWQSLALHTYFRVKQNNTRLLIIGLVVLVYLGGYSTLFLPNKS